MERRIRKAKGTAKQTKVRQIEHNGEYIENMSALK